MTRFSYSVFILLLFNQAIHSQNFSGESLKKQFTLYQENNILEKIYVHTDRELYLTGELIWFKVYCVDGSFHSPLDISKVAYVELLDRDNKVIDKLKIRLENGFGTGSIFLSASLPSDNYLLRAYTNWLKNIGPDFFFRKIIGVINPFVRTALKTNQIRPSLKVDFFPEGKDLVSGLKSKVAFKISTDSGVAIDFHGSLIDDGNDTILYFKPLKFGIGNFTFTPNKNKKYRVLIAAKGFNESTYSLPEVQSSGYVLSVTETPEKFFLEVNYSGERGFENEDIILFIHTRNIFSQMETKRLYDQKTLFELQKEQLRDGVSQLTIFNGKGQLVCERLLFKQLSSPSLLTSKIKKEEFGLREKITLQLTANSTVDQNLSVAVFKVDSLHAENDQTMAGYLWLSSDIRNQIESPEYYFTKSDESAQAVDNLMLTQKWGKFNWENVLSKTGIYPHFFPEYRGHVLQGIVTNDFGQPKKGATVFLASPSKIIDLHTSISDDKGSVSFELAHLYGKRKVLAQTDQSIDSTSHIEIAEPFAKEFSIFKIPDLNLSTEDKKYILERSVRMQLQNIFFDKHENSFQSPKIDSSAFYNKPDETYKLDDYTRFPVMEEVMREYVSGVVVRKKKDNFYFRLLDKKANKIFLDAPLILLDGIPIFSANEIMSFDPLKIKLIEVITSKYFLGVSEFSGIVSYSTYKGNLGGFTPNSKTKLVDYDGLQIPRKFYHPTYDASKANNNRIPDPRYLLYWNPSLEIDSSSTKEIDFFSSDVPGQYRIVVEGITKSGQVIHSSSYFQVNKH